MPITKREIKINHIPASVWGTPSRNVYLYMFMGKVEVRKKRVALSRLFVNMVIKS